MKPCDETNMYQKFNWGYVNVQLLANWETEGAKIRGMPNEKEIEEIKRADGPVGPENAEDDWKSILAVVIMHWIEIDF